MMDNENLQEQTDVLQKLPSWLRQCLVNKESTDEKPIVYLEPGYLSSTGHLTHKFAMLITLLQTGRINSSTIFLIILFDTQNYNLFFPILIPNTYQHNDICYKAAISNNLNDQINFLIEQLEIHNLIKINKPEAMIIIHGLKDESVYAIASIITPTIKNSNIYGCALSTFCKAVSTLLNLQGFRPAFSSTPLNFANLLQPASFLTPYKNRFWASWIKNTIFYNTGRQFVNSISPLRHFCHTQRNHFISPFSGKIWSDASIGLVWLAVKSNHAFLLIAHVNELQQVITFKLEITVPKKQFKTMAKRSVTKIDNPQTIYCSIAEGFPWRIRKEHLEDLITKERNGKNIELKYHLLVENCLTYAINLLRTLITNREIADNEYFDGIYRDAQYDRTKSFGLHLWEILKAASSDEPDQLYKSEYKSQLPILFLTDIKHQIIRPDDFLIIKTKEWEIWLIDFTANALVKIPFLALLKQNPHIHSQAIFTRIIFNYQAIGIGALYKRRSDLELNIVYSPMNYIQINYDQMQNEVIKNNPKNNQNIRCIITTPKKKPKHYNNENLEKYLSSFFVLDK